MSRLVEKGGAGRGKMAARGTGDYKVGLAMSLGIDRLGATGGVRRYAGGRGGQTWRRIPGHPGSRCAWRTRRQNCPSEYQSTPSLHSALMGVEHEFSRFQFPIWGTCQTPVVTQPSHEAGQGDSTLLIVLTQVGEPFAFGRSTNHQFQQSNQTHLCSLEQ